MEEAMACSNFASMCAEMQACDEALEYYYRALECFELMEDSEIKPLIAAAIYANIVRLYIASDDREKADLAFDWIEKKTIVYPKLNKFFDINLTRLYYYRYVQNAALEDEYKAKCIELFYQCKDYLTYDDECDALYRYLLDAEEYEELEKMFELVEATCVDEEIINMNLRVAKYRLKMYEARGMEQAMYEAAYQYVQLSDKKSEDTRRSFTTLLRLKSELANQKTKNLFLTAAAETDSLTGIANRAKLNAVVDELFMLANNEAKSLGVEMLDLDFFKQVNDTYGHAKGDELLIAVGQMLQKMVNEKVFVARYGGDEFIVYYYDMTDEEIISNIRYINRGIERIRDELGLENLSVSQGVVNHVPRRGNKAWDYMNAADECLYYVKNNGKNNARLVHSVREIKEKEWERIF